MITHTPTNQPPTETSTSKHILIGLIAALAAYWIGYSSAGGDDGPRTYGTHTHAINETATLDNGTTLQITDVREHDELFGTVTGITIQYNAGNAGHHPTGEQPELTPSGGETLHTADGIFTLTEQRLDTPLAGGLQKTLTLGYEIPVHELTNAQLTIDGVLFAGDFTRRINNG